MRSRSSQKMERVNLDDAAAVVLVGLCDCVVREGNK